MLTVSDLRVSYGSFRAVDGVSFALSKGVTALLGPNGAGKSTLMKALATVLRPDGGAVYYDGAPVHHRRKGVYRRRLGYLPQHPSWHEWMSARDVVASFAWMRQLPSREIPAAVERALCLVQLSDIADIRAGRLSGGQFQRLMLATTLVHDPAVLLLDEPTVGLDPEQRYELRQILHGYSAERVVLISTHILDDVSPIADRLLVMNKGRLRYDGALVEFASSAHAVGSGHATPLEEAYIRLLREDSHD